MKAKLYRANNTTEDIVPENGRAFSLGEIQWYVGGYFEMHALPDGDYMVMNEDAVRLKLPLNAAATVIGYNLRGCAGILGDVVVCPASMMRG